MDSLFRIFSRPVFLRTLEISAVLIIVITGWWLLGLRTATHQFPSNDDGSWMSVAAQLSRGEGFTTCWYENPFLEHEHLPRPEDTRYPGLSLILAAAFSIAGLSYSTALNTTTAIFLVFLLLFYFTIRKRYGKVTALTSLAVTTFSLMQLYWNSFVFTEGLFAVVLCVLVAIVWFADTGKIRTWIMLGMVVSLLYYIRLNGILFLAGLPLHVWINRKKPGAAIKQASAAFAAFMVCSAPWMLRSFLVFGNFLHIAGGAGAMRSAASDPRDWTFFEFLSHYSPFILVKMTFAGMVNFFKALILFEKNLPILPLAAFFAALLKRRSVRSPFSAAGFGATIFACFYLGYNEAWGAVRYASPFLPFMYAFGINVLVHFFRRIGTAISPRLSTVASFIPALFLLSTLYYPHRFYIRTLSAAPRRTFPEKEHAELIDSLVGESEYYFADSYGHLAFTTTRKCVGIQLYLDSTFIPEYLEKYSPVLLVLSESETKNPRIIGIINEIQKQGWEMQQVARLAGGIYFRMRQLSEIADKGTVREPTPP